jgi:biotin carboxyl carrier protein
MALKKYMVGQQVFNAHLKKAGTGFVVQIKTDEGIEDFSVDWALYDQHKQVLRFYLDGTVYEVFSKDVQSNCLSIKGQEFIVSSIANDQVFDGTASLHFSPATVNRASANLVTSPIAGRVIRLLCSPNQTVKQGDRLVVIESMKMENEICAHRGGVIKTLFISETNLVQQNQPLVEFVVKGESDDSAPKSIDAQTSV